MPSDSVRVVVYRPEWVDKFLAEKARILETMGELLLGIEHVGSTSVPGLAAKPVVDMMPAFNSLQAFDQSDGVERMQALGYLYRDEFEDVMPERRYFVLLGDNPEHPKDHRFHVHMVVQNSDFWVRHIAFRDYLRTHPNEAKRYGDLKQKIAPQFTDTYDYADAKHQFVKQMEQKALVWWQNHTAD
jgi:GrpB-like predicted nucleotidyltransferase (UPF0157 family)